MALANLNINVNANVSNVVNAMADVKAVTNASMFKSSQAVNDFQKNFAQDAAIVQAQSKAIGSEMGKSSVEVTKAAQVSADSLSGISASADASLASVKDLTKGLGDAGQALTKSMGPEAAAQMKSATDRVEEFVATRVAIVAAGLALGAVAGTIVAVGVAAYKASGFLAGLITGESYKSANIDALIATNDKVIDLQKSLSIAAQDANAMNDALSRLGINKSDITTVAGNADSVLRGGKTSELDRLGVAYKGLDTPQVIENAKKKLDEYTEGWDRNSAAVAMGLGSYEQMTNYLKVNQKELQNSKERLDDYGLGIGPETQEAVKRYQAAMLLFNNETRLMGEGFKRVIADNVMPLLTNFAGYLKDGWPSVVNFFRGVTASFSSILLGLDSAAYLAIKGTIASISSFVDVTIGVARAIAALATGDMKGAQDALKNGWDNAGKTMAAAGKDMVQHSENTVKALKAAWAIDDRTGALGGKGPKGLTFVAAPAAEAIVKDIVQGLTDAQKEAQRQIKEWLRSVWDVAATELAAEDFSSDITKKLGILTPKNTGFTKNPEMGLGTPKLKSLIMTEEEKEAARQRAKTLQGILMSTPDINGNMNGFAQRNQNTASMLDTYKSDEEMKTAILAKSKAEQLAIQEKFDNDMLQSQFSAAGKATDLMVEIAGNSKDAQLAALAIQTTIAVAQIQIAGRVAQMMALAQLGPIAGLAMAGQIEAMMWINTGLTLAAGVVKGAKIDGGRATGGPVSHGASYLVGERGPKIFTPGASGQITSNDKLHGLGGQTVNVTNVNQISTGVTDTVRAEIMRLVPSLNQSAVNAVKGAMRGGHFQGVPV